MLNLYNIVTNIMFNTGLLCLIFGIFFLLLSLWKRMRFLSQERCRFIYPEDYEYFKQQRHRTDTTTTVAQWKRDRFAYRVWTRVLMYDDTLHGEKKTDLPFTEWIETVNPKKREWWMYSFNERISPDYPGSEDPIPITRSERYIPPRKNWWQ